MFRRRILHNTRPFLFFVLQPILTKLLSFAFTFLLSFILLYLQCFFLLIYHVMRTDTCNKPHTLRDAITGRNRNRNCAASTLVVHSPRRLPVALRGSLNEELDTVVQQGIIAKVDRPTDSVNSYVCVTKPNGKLRLCLDPKDLNKAIKRPHQLPPTLDDVLQKLSGA